MGSDRTTGIGAYLVAVALALGAGLANAPDAGAGGRSEYDVKAAILYNMVNFVEWPVERAADGELRICLAGELSDPAPFVDLGSQVAAGRRLVVVPEDGAPSRECDVVFLAGQNPQQLRAELDRARNKPVLLIAEQPGAAQEGAVVNLTIVNKKVRFEINAGAARRIGLKVSSKLLKLATAVIDGGSGGD